MKQRIQRRQEKEMSKAIDIIENLKSTVATLESELASVSGVLLGQGHIVVCQGMPLQFDVADMVASNPRPCGTAGRANRFTKGDAERVAAGVQNGNGEAGRAVHVRDAILEQLEETRSVLAMVEGEA